MLTIIEILAICGMTQIITSSYLFAPVRSRIPTVYLKYMVTCSQCIGFWMGFLVYGAIALLTHFSIDVSFSFPLANAVVSTVNSYVQFAMVFMLCCLMSICAVLVNHVIELMHFVKVYYVTEVEKAMMLDQVVSQTKKI